MFAALVIAAQTIGLGVAHDSTDPMPAIVTRARLDTGVINFRALVLPETVYVGQQATYQLGIFVDERVRDRVRHMEATAPEMRSMLAYDAPPPISGLPWRTAGSRRYEVHVYERPIFPLSPGRLTIPPAHLSYAMPLSFSFFSREEDFELRSDSAVLVAIEPPPAGRPPDYAGAVGRLRAEAHLDAGDARVGVPMTLTVRISGVGNVKLLPRPHLAMPWASLVEAGERVSLSQDALMIHGVKEFDWVVTPLMPGRVTLPRIRYPYFDPIQERYQVAETAAQSYMVASGRLATLDTAKRATPRWSVRTVYRGALPEPPYTRPPFWLLLAVAPLPAAALLIARRPHRRRTHAVPPARGLRDLVERADANPSPRDVRRLFLRAVGARVHASTVALGEPAVLERTLRRAGTSREVATAAATLVAALNTAAFGTRPAAPTDAARRAYELYRAIDAEARRIASPRGSVVLLLICLLGVGSTWVFAAPLPEAGRFAAGVEAYTDGRYGEAAAEFGGIAVRVPRAADAWANLGTAAWAAGDTARASLGWQRALRLEPRADDVRERLERLMSTTGPGQGAVPSLPVRPIALLAAAFWLGGWGIMAVRLRRRTPGVSLAVGLVAGAVIIGLAAAQLDARLSARGLNVVATTGPLHLLPLLGTDATAAVRVGDVARVLERRGVWARVVADGERDGWIEAARLLPLDRD
jgi:hypothetical protein